MSYGKGRIQMGFRRVSLPRGGGTDSKLETFILAHIHALRYKASLGLQLWLVFVRNGRHHWWPQKEVDMKQGVRLYKGACAHAATTGKNADAPVYGTGDAIDVENCVCSATVSISLSSPKILMLELVELIASKTMLRHTPGRRWHTPQLMGRPEQPSTHRVSQKTGPGVTRQHQDSNSCIPI